MSDTDERQARSAHKPHLALEGLDAVPSQAGNNKATENTLGPSLSPIGADVGDAELSNRIRLGDPDPTKEIHDNLDLLYRIAMHVLNLARANHTFHLSSVIIARQAVRRVLVFNAEMATDGPTRAQRDERKILKCHIVDLNAVIRGWGSCSSMNRPEAVVSEGQQQRSLATPDRGQDQKGEVVSQNVGQATRLQRAMAQPTVDQCIDQIKTQYYRFFLPTSSRDDTLNLLLRRDQYPRPIAFEASQQSHRVVTNGSMLQTHFSDLGKQADTEKLVPTLEVSVQYGQPDTQEGSHTRGDGSTGHSAASTAPVEVPNGTPTIEFTDLLLRSTMPLHPYLTEHPCLSLQLMVDGKICGETRSVNGDLATGIWDIGSTFCAYSVEQSVTFAVIASTKGLRTRFASANLSMAELFTLIKVQPGVYQEFNIGLCSSMQLLITCRIKVSQSFVTQGL